MGGLVCVIVFSQHDDIIPCTPTAVALGACCHTVPLLVALLHGVLVLVQLLLLRLQRPQEGHGAMPLVNGTEDPR